jgi:hypothetical protein
VADLQRLQVKFYLEDEASLSPQEAFRVFSEWIPASKDEILIDVADYTHIEWGPQTVLIGHDANYTLDNTDGRMGVVYAQKSRGNGDASDRLRGAFGQALKACRRLEEHRDLKGRVRFCGSETVLVVNDRLRAPNTETTLGELRADLDAFLGVLFAGSSAQVERDDDARQRLSMRIQAAGDFDVAGLLSHLGI